MAGATEYQDSGTYFAVDDDVVVLAGSKRCSRRRSSAPRTATACPRTTSTRASRVCPTTRSRACTWTCRGCSRRSDAEAARKIEWVEALQTLGLTLSAQEDSIDVEFNLKTEGDLSDEDLPVASGDEAAKVVQRPGEIGVGLRDPASWSRSSSPRSRRSTRTASATTSRASGRSRQARPGRRQGPDRPADRQPLGVGDDRRGVRRARRAEGPRGGREDRRQGSPSRCPELRPGPTA